jgi:hypothetical protein
LKKRRVARYQQRELDSKCTRIPADLSQQRPNNSYSPKEFYEDIPFKCIRCGIDSVWTAREQKWWYEIVKASTYSRPTRCLDCRRAMHAAAERVQRKKNGNSNTGPFE